MQYAVYAVGGKFCTLVYAVLGICGTWCMLYLVYAVLGVCCTRCRLYLVLTLDHGMERYRAIT
jgi:uncharacterized membrane protein YuzA (DUF378 family)